MGANAALSGNKGSLAFFHAVADRRNHLSSNYYSFSHFLTPRGNPQITKIWTKVPFFNWRWFEFVPLVDCKLKHAFRLDPEDLRLRENQTNWCFQAKSNRSEQRWKNTL